MSVASLVSMLLGKTTASEDIYHCWYFYGILLFQLRNLYVLPGFFFVCEISFFVKTALAVNCSRLKLRLRCLWVSKYASDVKST